VAPVATVQNSLSLSDTAARRFVGKCSVGSLPWSVVFGQRAGCAAAGGRRPPPHGIRRSSSPRVRNETYLAVGGACIEDSHSNEGFGRPAENCLRGTRYLSQLVPYSSLLSGLRRLLRIVE
jgi:hypothetical protein